MKNFSKVVIVIVVLLLIIIGGAYYMLANQSSHVRVIPKDAITVLRIDAKSLALKSKYREISTDEDLKKLFDKLELTEDARRKLLSIIKNPTSTGLNLFGDLYTFVAPPKDIKRKNAFSVGFVAPLMNKGAFEKTFNEIVEAIGDETKFTTENDLSYVSINDEAAFGWNKKAFFVLSNPKPADEEETLNLLKERLKATSAESILDNKKFVSFSKKENDLSLWASSNYIAESLKDEIVEEFSQHEEQAKKFLGEKELNIAELLPDNYAYVTLNFKKGSVKATANIDTNKKLSTLVNKFLATNYKSDPKMWSALPGENPLLILSSSFDSEKTIGITTNLLKTVREDEKLAHFLKIGEEQLSMSAEEVIGNFAGNCAGVVSDVDLNGFVPMPTVTFAFSMKDQKLFDMLVKKLEFVGFLKEDGECFKVVIPEKEEYVVYTNFQDNIFKISNKRENVITADFKDKSLEENKSIKTIKRSTGALYTNLDLTTMPEKIVQLIKSTTDEDYKKLEKYAITKSLTIASTKENALEVEIALTDEKENALYTIISTSRAAMKEFADEEGIPISQIQ